MIKSNVYKTKFVEKKVLKFVDKKLFMKQILSVICEENKIVEKKVWIKQNLPEKGVDKQFLLKRSC